MRKSTVKPTPQRNAFALCSIALLLVVLFALRYWFLDSSGAPKQITSYVTASTLLVEDVQAAADALIPARNPYPSLSVPTYVNEQDGVYFLVDCYHNQIIYHDNLTDPLTNWSVLTSDMDKGHVIVSDGVVYLADDTENNRILVFEKVDDKFIQTQCFENIGDRPHYIQYEKSSGTFYAWSSMSGELYCFQHTREDSRMYLTEVRKIPALEGVYVRSFTISGKSIYFVSGQSQIIQADLKTLEVKKTYPVPDEIAGMVQLLPVPGGYLITVSTDNTGDQSYATILYCEKLSDLGKTDDTGKVVGKYEDVYSYFVGGGTPYYITRLGDTYYMTEHRIPGHSVWSFQFRNKQITDVQAVY